MSNSIDQLYAKSSLVEFHQHLFKMARPSAISNSIDVPPLNNVELHRHITSSSAVQRCRTPSTAVHRFHLRLRFQSGMSNSIDASQSVPPFNAVELHRLSDADPSCVQSRDSSRTIRHGELSSCAIHTLNTCNLTSNAAVSCVRLKGKVKLVW